METYFTESPFLFTMQSAVNTFVRSVNVDRWILNTSLFTSFRFNFRSFSRFSLFLHKILKKKKRHRCGQILPFTVTRLQRQNQYSSTADVWRALWTLSLDKPEQTESGGRDVLLCYFDCCQHPFSVWNA